jgi:hypothetical protein
MFSTPLAPLTIFENIFEKLCDKVVSIEYKNGRYTLTADCAKKESSTLRRLLYDFSMAVATLGFIAVLIKVAARFGYYSGCVFFATLTLFFFVT